jgi:hypothetical protein
MRSNVSRKVLLLFGMLAFTATLATAEKTQCECPKPPGGGHGCEDQQIAYCKVKGGECVGWCGSVKTASKQGEELAAAILSESLQTKVTPRDLRGNAEYLLIYSALLKSGDLRGAYRVAKGSEEVFLQVPGSLAPKVAALTPPGRIEPKPRFPREPGMQVSDAEITAKIKAKLATEGDINPFNIDVDTNSGVVTLQGRVSKEGARTKAEQTARETAGVKRVINLVKVGDQS